MIKLMILDIESIILSDQYVVDNVGNKHQSIDISTKDYLLKLNKFYITASLYITDHLSINDIPFNYLIKTGEKNADFIIKIKEEIHIRYSEIAYVGDILKITPFVNKFGCIINTNTDKVLNGKRVHTVPQHTPECIVQECIFFQEDLYKREPLSIDVIKQSIKKIVPTKVWSFLKKNLKKENIQDRNIDEHKQIYYIIRYNNCAAGLFSVWLYVISEMEYALKMGYIPVVDLKFYWNPLLQSREQRDENPWEFFWNQPSHTSINQALKSNNYIINSGNKLADNNFFIDYFKSGRKNIEKWHILAKEYSRLNDQTYLYFDRMKEHVFGNKKGILGVAIRRAFEWGERRKDPLYKYHSKQKPIDLCIMDIKECIEKWKYNYIFLSCDDFETIEIMKEEFGDSLLILDRPRMHLFKDGEIVMDTTDMQIDFYRESNVELTALEYLTEVYLLADCDALIGSNTSGIKSACILNGMKYEYCAINEDIII